MLQICRAAVAALVVTAFAAPVAAQQAITQADIQRLEDAVYQAGADVSLVRARDAARAGQLRTELDDLRDEVVYLKVKLRKDGSVPRTEYTDVRDRVTALRTRARDQVTVAAAPAAPAPAPKPAAAAVTPARTTTTQASAATAEVATGTEIDVRLQNRLNSGTAMVEDRFEATTIEDLVVGGRTVVPAGAVLRGVVTDVQPASRTNRTGRMTLSFDQMTVNGRAYPIRGTVTEAIQGEGIRGETARLGTGAGAGAIIGGLLGGFRGALLGVLIGAGGTLAATEGEQVDVPQGTVLRVRFDSPVQLQAAR